MSETTRFAIFRVIIMTAYDIPYRKYTVNFYDSTNSIKFSTSFLELIDTEGGALLISAAGSLYNPTNLCTIIKGEDIDSSTSLKQHFTKKSIIEMFKSIEEEFQNLIYNLPIGLYEYRGIRIVNSAEMFHKCTHKDVIDMDSVDLADMIKVKYAAALVHAFIILQTEEKLPDWLEEELEVHRAVNILEG